MSKAAGASESQYRLDAAALGLTVEQEFVMPEREIPPDPPRLPVVGDEIAFPVLGQTYFTKEIIAKVEGVSISYEFQPEDPRKAEYDALIASGATEIPRRLVDHISLYFKENNFTLSYLATPLAATYMTVSGGYGTGDCQWLFADDPQVRWPTEDELYAAELRSQFSNATRLTLAFADDGFRDGQDSPPCRVCGKWPCERKESLCPDYELIAKKGYNWLSELRRLETPQEISARITCGKPAVKEPTMSAQIEMTLAKRRAA